MNIFIVSVSDPKDYYLCKSGRHFSAVARTPEWPDYNEERRKEYNDSDDYTLMPECPGMTDEEAADVVKEWCVQPAENRWNSNGSFFGILSVIGKPLHIASHHDDQGDQKRSAHSGELVLVESP